MKWAPQGSTASAAIILETLADLERFLSEGAPHASTLLMWPRISPAKTFEALAHGGNAYRGSCDAVARISRAGERFEVEQVDA